MGALGERLKREREKRKIALQEVASATKIGTRYLRAIEEDKFDELPGGVFNKGFIKAYARHLGLDADQALADYDKAFRETHPEELTPPDPEAEGRKIMEQRARRVQQERPRMEQLPWGKVAAAILLFACALVTWGAYSHFNKRVAPTKEAATRAGVEVSPKAPLPKRAVKHPVAEQQTSQTLTPPEKLAETETVAPGTFLVAIHAREDSWIHIEADGKPVLEDTLPAEAQKSVQAANQLVIKAGNIGALDFWFNGQKLPVQGDIDQVKTVTFDAAGLVPQLPKAQAVAVSMER